MASKRKTAKQAESETTEAYSQPTEVKTSEELVSFDNYIAKAKVKPTLVASFKYEALKTEKALQDRTEDEWRLDFEAQSKRKYPSL